MSSSDVRVINSKRSINWSCKNCESIGSDVNSLKAVIVSLQEQVKKLNECVQSITDGGATTSVLDGGQFEELIREVEDRMERKNNLVIYGLPELPGGLTRETRIAGETEGVLKVLKTINPDFSVRELDLNRLGKFNPAAPKARPIKVRMANRAQVFSFLRNSKQLRSSSDYSGVSLSVDRTHRQMRYYDEVKSEVEVRKRNGENVELRFIRGVPSVKTLN